MFRRKKSQEEIMEDMARKAYNRSVKKMFLWRIDIPGYAGMVWAFAEDTNHARIIIELENQDIGNDMIWYIKNNPPSEVIEFNVPTSRAVVVVPGDE